MNDPNILEYSPPSPESETLQFEKLIEIYTDLGLTRAHASAAAQADYLSANVLAFRQRGALDGSYLLVHLQAA